MGYVTSFFTFLPFWNDWGENCLGSPCTPTVSSIISAWCLLHSLWHHLRCLYGIAAEGHSLQQPFAMSRSESPAGCKPPQAAAVGFTPRQQGASCCTHPPQVPVQLLSFAGLSPLQDGACICYSCEITISVKCFMYFILCFVSKYV